uniref:Fibronectin type-III domain-containing protein n=1 Tax=Haplochromis burtoni TaxID=8153 RepID=A0A3Q2V040_HAPBU
MRYNDVLGTSTAQQFPQIDKKIKSFKEMCSEFKLDFQQTLAKKLPSIRGGGEEEADLAEILKKRLSSPFSSKNLNEWMDCKEREVDTLMSFTRMMKNTKIISSQNDLYKESLSAEHVVCFVFTSLGKDEPYLSALSKYLRGKTNPDLQDPHTHDVEKEQWYASKEVTAEMRRKEKLFSDFAEANEENKNMKFLTVGLTNETQEGSSIYLYEGGFAVSENFEPPSKPETVTAADINHNSVTLKISPPRFGAENITSYSVEYCVSGEDGWQQKTEAKAEEVTVRDLKPNTEYVFRCRAVTSAGVGPANVISDAIKTLPCSPPGKPRLEPNLTEISVSWEKPAELGEDVQILSYMVEYSKTDNNEEALQWNQTKSAGEKVILSGLQTETEYAVRVRCDCGSAGRSKESIIVKVCTTTFNRLAELLKNKSEKIKSDSSSVYKLPLTEEHMNIDGCRKFNFGEESTRLNRTIILFGAIGSGKSTLIDGMINYIVGVEWGNGFRFKFINEDQSTSRAHSQTSEVTVYKINHQDGFQIPFSLTIIDTPGFGDTRGIERDREITEQLRNLFSAQHGVTDIDAVCFVAQAASARLTATQKYVFDSVLSIFGKDVAENIRILATFADGQRPPVLEAINAAGVPCPKTKDGLPVHFKFNNSALFAHKRSSEGDRMSDVGEGGHFDKMFWEMGTKSMKSFFTALNVIETKRLTLTQEVLRERKQLEISVENMQEQVKLGLAKLEEIKKKSEKLKEYEFEIIKNENFEIEVTVMKPFEKEISHAGNILNCQQCHFTCHHPCTIPNDAYKTSCIAVGSDGYCTQCPGKCYWNVHFYQKYIWEYKEVKEKKTVKKLKEKYDRARGQKMTVQGLVEKLKAEYESLQSEVVKLMERSSKCLNRLKETSLKTNPLSTPEYIDMLIEEEKSEGKPGWKRRVQSLMVMKEKAKLMAKIEKGEKLLH